MREWITLTEHEPVTFPREAWSDEAGTILWEQYGKQVAVEFPSPKTGHRWQLVSRGWAGILPLTRERGLRLLPKVPADHLFQMLAEVYGFTRFHFPEGLAEAKSLEGFADQLVEHLARMVIHRSRKGLYRKYTEKRGRLAAIRGKWEASADAGRSGKMSFLCRYRRLEADHEENQILAWTLYRSALGSWLGREARREARRAFHALWGEVTLRPVQPRDCEGRHYHRLNKDYEAMHTVCRLFLTHMFPGHRAGENQVVPFLIDMAALYERYVAAWLSRRLPEGYRLNVQERVRLGDGEDVHFAIDLVIRRPDGSVHSVLDTKYKRSAQPSAADLAQVAAYALTRKADEAILIYPMVQNHSSFYQLGDIRIRVLPFSLMGDLEANGERLVKELFQRESSI
ncbi:McrC family protein [Salinithrix halophila]|uniref:McrC family protein n=1 Tax=Salinithrix halophila TaxID=1485204 RepID=A0ABV8JFS0_9BACL